jgi:IS5 family transposase
MVGKVYHLPLRQSEGFVGSFFKMMAISKPVPDYSTLCRRASKLQVQLNVLQAKGQIIDIAIDSTGLKVYGEGEWKVRKHGWNKYRTWMKLHIGIDMSSQQIVVSALTTASVDDAEPVKAMVEEIVKDKEIKTFVGDGAYDKQKVYKQLSDRQIVSIIPTQHNAKKSKKNRPWLQDRDKTIEAIKQWGKKEWKKRVGYYKRSLAETAMYRYKTIIGDKLKSRKQSNQATETKISCLILNKMLQLAKPVSIKVD